MAGELRECGSELPEAANKSLDGESVLPLRAPSLLRNNFDGGHVVPSLRETGFLCRRLVVLRPLILKRRNCARRSTVHG